MNRTALSQPMTRLIARAVLIAGMAWAPLAIGGDSVKCVGSDGSVTLTDEGCATGERSVTVVAAAAEPVAPPARVQPQAAGQAPAYSPAAAPTVARTVQLVRTKMPNHGAIRHSLARFDPPSRALGRDVSTLKAARQAMILLDSAAQSVRAQRLAGLQ